MYCQGPKGTMKTQMQKLIFVCNCLFNEIVFNSEREFLLTLSVFLQSHPKLVGDKIEQNVLDIADLSLFTFDVQGSIFSLDLQYKGDENSCGLSRLMQQQKIKGEKWIIEVKFDSKHYKTKYFLVQKITPTKFSVLPQKGKQIHPMSQLNLLDSL